MMYMEMLTQAETCRCTNCCAPIDLNNNQCSNEAVKSLIKYFWNDWLGERAGTLGPTSSISAQAHKHTYLAVSHSKVVSCFSFTPLRHSVSRVFFSLSLTGSLSVTGSLCDTSSLVEFPTCWAQQKDRRFLTLRGNFLFCPLKHQRGGLP